MPGARELQGASAQGKGVGVAMTNSEETQVMFVEEHLYL